MKKREVRHLPVMVEEVCAALGLRAGMTVVDCTLGLGGHSAEMLKRVGKKGRLIALDFDPASIAIARGKLEATGGRCEIFQRNFAAVQSAMMEAGVEKVDGLLADLGVSSPQIDDAGRGFSYTRAGPLDMRMDPTRGQPASVLVSRLNERELAEAILEYGDETDAPKIARGIVEFRRHQPIVTTQQLMGIVCEARDFTLVRAAGAKLHPAARTFQALRILVNREMANLERLLTVLPEVLKSGGVAAIISFHSGEDRRVKGAFRAGLRSGIYQETSEEVIRASAEEVEKNPRARSAKLRWARR